VCGCVCVSVSAWYGCVYVYMSANVVKCSGSTVEHSKPDSVGSNNIVHCSEVSSTERLRLFLSDIVTSGMSNPYNTELR